MRRQSSRKPEELKKSLHAGRIPEAYQGNISEIKVGEVRRKVKKETEATEMPKSIYGTPEDVFIRASVWNNKKSHGSQLLSLKGLRNVTGEFALFCLGYNIERAKNLLGFEKMMELMAGA